MPAFALYCLRDQGNFPQGQIYFSQAEKKRKIKQKKRTGGFFGQSVYWTCRNKMALIKEGQEGTYISYLVPLVDQSTLFMESHR
jgi:hypothetical protein